MRIQFYPLPIDEIRDETPDAYTVFFQNPDPEVFSYLPGQYLTIKLNIDGEEIRRCFSLSSCHDVDEQLAITIKRVKGGRSSNYIRDYLKAGDIVEVLPPMGNFTLRPYYDQPRNHIMIGAGSGITPLMSMIKSVLHHEPESKVTLWYGNRDESSIIFKNQLIKLNQQYPKRLHLHFTLSRPEKNWKGFTGRLDKEKIYYLLSELFMTDEYRKYYYICGPGGLIESAEAAMDKHAVNPSDVHKEYYSAPAPSDSVIQKANKALSSNGQDLSGEGKKTEFSTQEVILRIDGKTYEVVVEPGKTILDAAVKAKINPPYSCQSGICTSCRAFLHSGSVAMDETAGLSKEELEEGYILTCQAHPLTEDVEIEYR